MSLQIDPDIKLVDVIGLEDAKEVLSQRLEDYINFKDKLKHPPSKGILMFGYPGTGKTMLANATINEYGKVGNVFFQIVGVSELTEHVGTTEPKIAAYFDTLRRRAEGKVIVLLMDEADQIIPKKTCNQASGAIVSERISALLKELDGLENKNRDVFIIATTNHPGRIEEAFLRSGRIDEHIKVDLPTDEQRKMLIKKYLGHIPGCMIADRIDNIADNTKKWTGADYRKLGSKLEIKYYKNREDNTLYQLDASDIAETVSKVNKQRKLNFKTFEDEYRKFMDAQATV